MLQKVVDASCELTDARYGALSLFDASGRIQQFLTHGVTPQERERIGDPPQGLGLLGWLHQLQERLRRGPAWEDNDLVFANAVGRPMHPSDVGRRSFRRLLERAGLRKMRFHDLRHTAATLLLAQNVHPKIVQELLGHTQISTTLDLYSHVTPTMQRQAAAAMESVLGAR